MLGIMLRRLLLAAALACLAVHALPARAVSPDAWRARMDAIDGLLRQEQWARAEKDTTELLRTIVERVDGGPGEAGFVAYPMAQLAVARAGLGDRIGAEWWWWSAQQVLPDIARVDLSPYGDVGAAVRDLGAPPRSADLPELTRDPERPFHFHLSDSSGASGMLQRAGAAPASGQALVEVPQRPVVPGKTRKEPASVGVRVVIDATGRMTQPVIVPPQPSPAHVAGALLSIETWRSLVLGNEPTAGLAHVGFATVSRDERPPARPPLSAGAVDKRADAVLAILRQGAGPGSGSRSGKEALKEAESLLETMLDAGFGRKDQEAPLARVLVFRARAAELAGDARLAAWSSRTAMLLSSEASGSALLELGVPAPPMPAEETSAKAISPDAVKAGLTPPMLLQRVEPRYPRSAMRSRAKGEVVLEAIIDEQGHVLLNRLIETADAVLTVTSLEAVRQWRYKPAMLDGKPQAVYLMVRIKYNLM